MGARNRFVKMPRHVAPGTAGLTLAACTAVCLTVVLGGASATSAPAGAAPVASSQQASKGMVRHAVGRSVVPGGWTIDPTPNASTQNDLSRDSCATAAFCVAVGADYGGLYGRTLIEQWNGTAWAIVASPDTSSTEDNQLGSVSCPTTTFCMAVGTAMTHGVDQTLVEEWNGSAWSIVPSPDATTSSSNRLMDVSCTSATACVAVGEAYTSPASILAMTWNGATWSLSSPVRPTSGSSSFFDGVSCASATFCVAAGGAYGPSPTTTLIEGWDGSRWSVMPSPDPFAGANEAILSVACSSTSSCVAAGFGSNGASDRTLIEQWNGAAWSVDASPDASATSSDMLNSVSCAGPTSCVAVGNSYASVVSTTYVTEVLAWDGTTWTLEASPNPGVTATYPDQAELNGVSCIGGHLCVASGDAYPGSGSDDATLVESAPIARPGYRLVASDGGIFTFGGASFNGSTGSFTLNKPIVGMAATPDGGGYWLVASDGGIFAFGDAHFYGSTGALTLNKPIVGMAATPNGGGYWLVASDGGIFTFGNAVFHGSTGALTLNKPIVGMAATPDGGGYWLVASDGGIFAFGDAVFHGSTGALTLNKPIVGMAATPDGKGYWLVASDGGIFAFGDAVFHGSTGALTLNKPIVGMAATPDGKGYWLVASDGGIFAFGDAVFKGSTGALVLNKPIVGMAA